MILEPITYQIVVPQVLFDFGQNKSYLTSDFVSILLPQLLFFCSFSLLSFHSQLCIKNFFRSFYWTPNLVSLKIGKSGPKWAKNGVFALFE